MVSLHPGWFDVGCTPCKQSFSCRQRPFTRCFRYHLCTKRKLEVGSVVFDSSQTVHQVWVWYQACLARSLQPGHLDYPKLDWLPWPALHPEGCTWPHAHGPPRGTSLDGSQSPAGAQKSLGQVISLCSLPSPASALLLHPYFVFPSPQDVFLASVPLLYCVHTSCLEQWDGALQAEL